MKTFPGIVQLAYSALTYPRKFFEKCDIFLVPHRRKILTSVQSAFTSLANQPAIFEVLRKSEIIVA